MGPFFSDFQNKHKRNSIFAPLLQQNHEIVWTYRYAAEKSPSENEWREGIDIIDATLQRVASCGFNPCAIHFILDETYMNAEAQQEEILKNGAKDIKNTMIIGLPHIRKYGTIKSTTDHELGHLVLGHSLFRRSLNSLIWKEYEQYKDSSLEKRSVQSISELADRINARMNCANNLNHKNEFDADCYLAIRDIYSAADMQRARCALVLPEDHCNESAFSKISSESHPSHYDRCQRLSKLTKMLTIEQLIHQRKREKENIEKRIVHFDL